ncbi:MAG: GSCFA domain-containing protein [Ectothiorhodospiraceae bacterium]|nr:GSCFA domain-containing protein [Ectothiorhodospiraceae bacterium]
MSDDAYRTCPYRQLPQSSYWRQSVAECSAGDIDPVGEMPFRLEPTDRIATAGSCFAQHIARYLQRARCNYFVAEQPPGFIDREVAERFQYGTFSARFGNIYTSRQLLQLFQRAYGRFSPVAEAWSAEGRWYDPFRPSVQPEGFRSLAELEHDRRSHLARVRRMFEECDCLVFTLGLTETWRDRRDGAVFPVCPGCGYGEFDPEIHEFVNLSVRDVEADLGEFVASLREVNPAVKVILTVSPVPLIATHGGNHVLSATTYSKSVLRVAAETMSREHEQLAYFPSYEIITSSASRGAYFADDLRSVKEQGVQHVMRLFFHHLLPSVSLDLDAPSPSPAPQTAPARPPEPSRSTLSAEVADIICDEDRVLG